MSSQTVSSPRDANHVPALLGTSSADGSTPVSVYADPVTHRLLVSIPGSGGSVTSVSVVSANGFAGTVATATTTPAITLSTTVTGILSGNGTAISAAATTGSGSVVLATSPTLVTPALGVASATSIGVSGIITTGVNGGTNGSVTFSGSTSGSTVLQANVAAGGTVTLPTSTGTLALTSQLTSGTVTSVSVTTANGVSGSVATATTTPAITLTLGAITPTTVNGNTFTTGSYTLTGTAAKTLNFTNTLTLSGTDSTTMTFPATSATVGGLGIVQTWTAQNKFNNIIDVNNAVTVASNAGTVPITFRLNTFTNSSAATMTITMATASAVDGQMTMVRIYDFSAVTQTITWVNTENSIVIAPTTSNGSTTLPLTVGFQYNAATSKWRCIASA